MKYFTDSPFEKMMMEKPKYGGGYSPPASPKKSTKRDSKKRELIVLPRETEDKK